MTKIRSVVAILATSGGLIVGPAYGQDPDQAPRWTNDTEFSWVASNGNSDTNTLGLRNLYQREWLEAKLSLETGWMRATSRSGNRIAIVRGPDTITVVEPTSETDGQRLYSKLRYQQETTGRHYWFSSWDTARDEPSNINRQFIFSGGVGTTWRDEDALTFRTSYGVSFTDERLTLEGINRFAGFRLFYGLRMLATVSTAVESELTTDGSFRDANDVRLDWLNAATVAVSSRIALKASVRLLFRNLPALETIGFQSSSGSMIGSIDVPKNKLDVNATTSLVLTF